MDDPILILGSYILENILTTSVMVQSCMRRTVRSSPEVGVNVTEAKVHNVYYEKEGREAKVQMPVF